MPRCEDDIWSLSLTRHVSQVSSFEQAIEKATFAQRSALAAVCNPLVHVSPGPGGDHFGGNFGWHFWRKACASRNPVIFLNWPLRELAAVCCQTKNRSCQICGRGHVDDSPRQRKVSSVGCQPCCFVRLTDNLSGCCADSHHSRARIAAFPISQSSCLTD